MEVKYIQEKIIGESSEYGLVTLKKILIELSGILRQ